MCYYPVLPQCYPGVPGDTLHLTPRPDCELAPQCVITLRYPVLPPGVPGDTLHLTPRPDCELAPQCVVTLRYPVLPPGVPGDTLHLTPRPDCELALQSLGAMTWYLQLCLLDTQLLSMRRYPSPPPPPLDSQCIGLSMAYDVYLTPDDGPARRSVTQKGHLFSTPSWSPSGDSSSCSHAQCVRQVSSL